MVNLIECCELKKATAFVIERTSGQPIFLVPGAALQERIRCRSCWSEVQRFQNIVFLCVLSNFSIFCPILNLLRMISASTVAKFGWLQWPMFLQAAGFQALAALLPVPAYGISWPSTLPRDRHRKHRTNPLQASVIFILFIHMEYCITMYHCTIHCITLLLCILFEGFLERMHYFRYFSRLYWFLGSNLSFPLSESHGPFRCWATAILSLCRFGLPGCFCGFCGFGGPGLCRTNLMESQRSQPRDPTSIQVLAHQTESWNCRYEIWRLECRSSCCSRSREVETYPTLGRFGSCCILVLWP